LPLLKFQPSYFKLGWQAAETQTLSALPGTDLCRCLHPKGLIRKNSSYFLYITFRHLKLGTFSDTPAADDLKLSLQAGPKQVTVYFTQLLQKCWLIRYSGNLQGRRRCRWEGDIKNNLK